VRADSVDPHLDKFSLDVQAVDITAVGLQELGALPLGDIEPWFAVDETKHNHGLPESDYLGALLLGHVVAANVPPTIDESVFEDLVSDATDMSFHLFTLLVG